MIRGGESDRCAWRVSEFDHEFASKGLATSTDMNHVPIRLQAVAFLWQAPSRN
jgi:hypothetical protein